MKQTLRQRLISLLEHLMEKENAIILNINAAVKAERYEDAARYKVILDQTLNFYNELDEILRKY